MPIKRVQFPDGSIHRVEVPEGATNEQIIAFVQSQQPRTAKPDFSNVQSQADTASAAPPPSIGQRIGRDLGLGARATLEGVGSTIGIFTDPLARASDKLLNTVAPPERNLSSLITGDQPQERRFFGTAREGFSSLADMVGLPEAESPVERVGTGITEALAGGGGIMGLGRSLATRAPGIGQAAGEFLSAMPGSQLAAMVGGSGAAGVTREAGGGAGAQTLAGLVGGIGTPTAAAVGQGTLRRLMRGGESGRQGMERNIADFRSVGAQPSVGQATGNGRTQGLESLLSGGPTSMGVMGRFAERQASDIGAGLGRKADAMLPNASAERAGRAIERGADTFAGNVRQKRAELYGVVDQVIPGDTRVAVSQTQQALADLTRLTPGAESTTAQLVNPKIAAIAKSLDEDVMAAQASGQGGIPYQAIKTLRTRIGEELDDSILAVDRPTAQYKRLYAALSQDMEQAARQQGPAAEAAMRRANGYMRASADRLEQVQRVIDKNGGPEKVYRAAMAGTQDGGTTLRAVMQSLPEDGQKAVTAAFIKRLGKATPGQQDATGEVFSAGTFMTNWNNVSAEAKRALFDRHGPKFVADMERIARVADRIKQGSKVFANPSGTTNRAAAYTYGTGLAGAAVAAPWAGPLPLVGLVLGGLTGNAAARAMTNPKFVAWLARSTEMPASALPQQVNVLKQIADDDPAVAEALSALQGQQPPQQ